MPAEDNGEEQQFWEERAESVARVSKLTEKYVNQLREKGYEQLRQIPKQFWEKG